MKSMKSMKYKKTTKKMIVYTAICASVFNLSACSVVDTAKTLNTKNLNLPNRNALSNDSLGTPWKNQSIATGLMYRTLFLIDADRTNIENDLIETYEVSDNGLQYRFTLKENVEWSDGEILDADDVIFSIKALLLSEQFNGIYQTAFINIIGSSDFINNHDMNTDLAGLTKDGNTVILNLKKPTVNMMAILSQFAILPEHCFVNSDIPKMHNDDYWKNPVVTGMYIVDEIVPSEYIKLSYNDKYIGQKPKIDTITLLFNYGLNDDQVLTDLYYTNNISEILECRSMLSLEEYAIDSDFYRYLVFNIDKQGEIDSTLNDYRFREAIACGIDREAIVENIYYGIGDVIDNNILYPMFPSYEDNDIYYNPEKSIELLNDMNFDFDRVIKLLYYYDDALSQKFMIELARQLGELGIQTEIIEPNGMSIFEFDDYDIVLKGLSTFDVSEWYAEYQSTNALHMNLIGNESLFDGLLEDFPSTFSTEDHINILTKLQELEFDTLYKYPLFTLRQVMYANKDVLQLPDDIVFGNAWYNFDINFEEWDIIQD